MQPLDIQVIGNEVAIRWQDGSESYVALEKLRRACPCAGCKGETDIMGEVHRGPEATFSPRSFELREMKRVGSYGIQPVWGDGHSTGIYSFDYLHAIARVQN
jgi:DUF971 family protein